MDFRLEARFRKLESKRAAASCDVFAELSHAQLKALSIVLHLERDIRTEDCLPDAMITDEMLWDNAMSREAFESAFNSITLDQFERMVRHVQTRATH